MTSCSGERSRLYSRACSLRESFQRARYFSFTLQHRSLNPVHPGVPADHAVVIFFRLAVVPEHPDFLGEGVIVGHDGAGLAIGAQVLSRIEAEAAGDAQGAGLSAFVLGAVGLAGVFDDGRRCALATARMGSMSAV